MANSASHAALPYPIKGARFSLGIPYLNTTGAPTDPTTPDTEISKDDAAAADTTEEVSSPKNSMGLLTLTGDETNCSLVTLAAKSASGPNTTLGSVHPRVLAAVASGVSLSAGSSSGGTLTAALAYDVTGCFVKSVSGTGAAGGSGSLGNQARKIITYNTSTGVFTVAPNFETALDATTTVDILLPEGVTLGMMRALNPTTAGRTLDVTATGEAGIDLANIGDPANDSASALGIVWAGTATFANGTITFTGGSNYPDHAANIAVALRDGTNARGKSRWLASYSGSGEVWNVDPAWNSDGETNPSGTVHVIVIAAYKAPTGVLTIVNATQIGGVAQTGLDIGANITTVLNRIGAFTGSGLNTILGFFKALGSKAASLTPSDMGGTYDNTTDSNEAVRDNMGTAQTGDSFARLGAPAGASIAADVATRLATSGYTAPPTAAAVADQVWEETLADHSGTSGSTAAALNAAGSAGDPWNTALPGAYGAGSAGKIIGDNLDAKISTRTKPADTQAAVTLVTTTTTVTNDVGITQSAADKVWNTAARSLTTFGSLVADIATAVWGAATRVLTAGTNIVLAKGTGVTGFTDVSSSDVQTAAGAALTAYDPPTQAELASAVSPLATTAGLSMVNGNVLGVPAATAALVTTDHGSGSYVRNTEPLDSTAAQAAAAAALAAYDGPTKAELDTAAAALPAAVLSAAAAAPIAANVKEINDVTMGGTGVEGDEFAPAA